MEEFWDDFDMPEWVKEQEEADREAALAEGMSGESGGGSDPDEDRINGAQHLVLLLDCSSKSMWIPCIKHGDDNDDSDDDDEDMTLISPMDAALTLTEKFLRTKIMNVATKHTGKRDGVGVILYGCRPRHESYGDEEDEEYYESKKKTKIATSHILLPLEQPGVPHIRKVAECLPDDNLNGARRVDLQKEYGPSEEGDEKQETTSTVSMNPLQNALQMAKDEYDHAKCVRQRPSKGQPPDSKSIWIITDNDNPYLGKDDSDVTSCIKAAENFRSSGMDIFVLPLGRKKFIHETFWDKVVSRPESAPMLNESEDAMSNLDSLVEMIQAQWAPSRKQFSLPLLLPDWRDHPDSPGIMLDFFRPVNIRKKPGKDFKIHVETKKETVKQTKIYAPDGDEVPLPSKQKDKPKKEGDKVLVKYYEFGGERVYLKPEEVLKMKRESNSTEKGSLILLGFRDIDSIPLHYMLDRSYFMFPNENLVKGSAAAFANLHAAMLRKNVLAIGEFIPRITSTTRMVAIYPQAEEKEELEDGSEVQTRPPGMVLIELPFQTEIRDFGEDTGAIEPTEESITAAMDLMRKLRIKDYVPGTLYENISLAHFWSYVEAVALNTPVKPLEDYEPLMEEDEIIKVAGDKITKFEHSLPGDLEPEKSTGRKRKTVSAEDDTGLDWRELYRTSSLSDCTAVQLKQYLRSRGMRVGGKKEELLLRVERNIQEEIEKDQVANG